MLNVFIRTVILYALIVVLMRLTGKRQIGQLELTELVTAFMISELAANPISNNSIPIAYGIIPAVTLVCLEVFLSYISVKSKKFRKLITGNALALVKKGKIDCKTMNTARITADELLSAARCAGVRGLSEVAYAFLEPNGTISVIPKSAESPPSASDLGVKSDEKGAEHALIIDGKIDFTELKKLGKDKKWLLMRLKENGFGGENEVFYMGADDAGGIYTAGREKKK